MEKQDGRETPSYLDDSLLCENMPLIFPKIESLFFLLAVLNLLGDPLKLSFPDFPGEAVGESDRGNACFLGVVGGECEEKDDLGWRPLPLGDEIDVRAASEEILEAEAGGWGGGVEGAGGVVGVAWVVVRGAWVLVRGASSLGFGTSDFGSDGVANAAVGVAAVGVADATVGAAAAGVVDGSAGAGVAEAAEGVASTSLCWTGGSPTLMTSAGWCVETSPLIGALPAFVSTGSVGTSTVLRGRISTGIFGATSGVGGRSSVLSGTVSTVFVWSGTVSRAGV